MICDVLLMERERERGEEAERKQGKKIHYTT